MKKMEFSEFNYNPFELIGNDWMLITAKKDEKVNTMTASWGGIGIMWNKKVAYVFIRESRYTKELVDAASEFSLTFFNKNKYQKTLSYLGTVSGRYENKIEKSGLTLTDEGNIPYFEEAKLVLLCKKLSNNGINTEGFLLENLDKDFYSNKDYHTMYIVEITQILTEDQN